MSRCRCKCKRYCCCEPSYMMEPAYVQPSYDMPTYTEPSYMVPSNCGRRDMCKSGCSFSCLIILILILLVFSCQGNNGYGLLGGGDNCGGLCGGNLIDKGIIFIVALYYLSCNSPCA